MPASADRTAVLVADDQEMVRTGLRTMLESDPRLVVVGEAADGDEAVRETRRLRPDVVLMDLRMPVVDGIEATRRVLALPPPVPAVLVVTTFELDELVVSALRAGAQGFLLKTVSTGELLSAVHAVVGGGAVVSPSLTRRLFDRHVRRSAPLPLPEPFSALTAREKEVLLEVAAGRSNREIGARLHLAETTVKSHVSALLMTLGLANRVQVAVFAYEHGLVTPGSVREPESG